MGGRSQRPQRCPWLLPFLLLVLPAGLPCRLGRPWQPSRCSDLLLVTTRWLALQNQNMDAADVDADDVALDEESAELEESAEQQEGSSADALGPRAQVS